MFKISKLAVIFFITVAVAAPFFCLADDHIGLSVDQTVFTFNLAPGASQDFKVKVENISQSAQKMAAESEDFAVGENNKISILSTENELSGMKNWVKINETNWELESKGSKEINFSVSVPEDATVGSHYSIVSLRAYPQITGENFQTTIVSGRIGIYIMVNVLGEVSGKGEIEKFSAPVIVGDKVSLNAEFKNLGNIHYIPHGEIKIKNLLTRRGDIIDLEKHFVFPGKSYDFETDWQNGSVFGFYRAQAAFVDGDGKVKTSERFIFGKLFFLLPLGLIGLIFWGIKMWKKYELKSKNEKLKAKS